MLKYPTLLVRIWSLNLPRVWATLTGYWSESSDRWQVSFVAKLSASPEGRLPGDHSALSEVLLLALAVILVIRVVALRLNLSEEAGAVDDTVAAGDGKRKVLEWLLELALLVSLKDLDAWGGLEVVRVVELSNVLALVANVVILINWEDVFGVLLEILEVELSLKSGIDLTLLLLLVILHLRLSQRWGLRSVWTIRVWASALLGRSALFGKFGL